MIFGINIHSTKVLTMLYIAWYRKQPWFESKVSINFGLIKIEWIDSGDQKHQRPMVLLLVNTAMLNDVFNEVNSFWSLKPIIKRSLSPIAVKIVMQDFQICYWLYFSHPIDCDCNYFPFSLYFPTQTTPTLRLSIRFHQGCYTGCVMCSEVECIMFRYFVKT